MAGCAIVGALLLNMVLGTPSSWGSFTVYVTSYLRLSNPNIRYEDTAWVTATSGAMVGFVSFIGGMLLDRWGPRPTALLGSVVLSLGVLASAWTVKYGFLPFFLTYAVVFGFGSGIVYSAPMKCAMQWVPHRRGLVTGFVTCSSGLGPMFAIAIQTGLINPHNLQPEVQPGSSDAYYTDETMLSRVPFALLVLGITYTMLSILGSLLLVERSASLDPEDKEAQESQPILESADFSPGELLQIREFWLMWFCYFFSMIGVNFAINYVKVFGQNVGVPKTDFQLSFVVMAAVLCNGFGRLGWGWFGDAVSFRAAMQGMSGINALFTASLFLCAQNFLTYLLAMCIIFACIGGASSIWAGAVSLYFGDKNFGRNFGLLVMAGGTGWIVGAAGIWLLRHRLTDVTISLLSAACSTIAAGCGLLMRDRQDFLQSNIKRPTASE